RQIMNIYDHLFGTLIGAIGAGDFQIHQAVLERAQGDDPSRRVVTPFASAHGWPEDPMFVTLISLASDGTHPTVRYACRALRKSGDCGSRGKTDPVRGELVNHEDSARRCLGRIVACVIWPSAFSTSSRQSPDLPAPAAPGRWSPNPSSS